MKKIFYLLAAMMIAVSACENSENNENTISESVATPELRSDEFYFFYSVGCPHCKAALEYINETYPDLRMSLVNVGTPAGYELFVKCAQKFELGNKIGTPLMCMGDHYLMGWAPTYAGQFDQYVKPFLPQESVEK